MIPLPPGFSNWEPPEQEKGGGFLLDLFSARQDEISGKTRGCLTNSDFVLQISSRSRCCVPMLHSCYIHDSLCEDCDGEKNSVIEQKQLSHSSSGSPFMTLQ